MHDIYITLKRIQHGVKKIRDLSSGSYRVIARYTLVDIDKLIELIEDLENRKDLK